MTYAPFVRTLKNQFTEISEYPLSSVSEAKNCWTRPLSLTEEEMLFRRTWPTGQTQNSSSREPGFESQQQFGFIRPNHVFQKVTV